jgi:hypothetical protein
MLKAIPLGLVTVTTAGTPVPITAAMITAAGDGRPPSGGVCKIDVYAQNGNAGIVFVKMYNGANPSVAVTVAPLLVPANGNTGHFCLKGEGNQLNPLSLAIDSASNGDGAFVTLWVE